MAEEIINAQNDDAGKNTHLSSRNPFSLEQLSKIFRAYPGTDRVTSRESGLLEFKKTFNWANKDEYSRTCAAFANAKGGFIVFGIADKPRTLVGLTGHRFHEIDPAEITQFLNEVFSPEIHWEIHSHVIGDRQFGLLYVHESLNKPVFCIKSHGAITAGDIYYRYRGRTERIKYPELRYILNEQRQRDNDNWLRLIGKIAKIGVSQAAVFDSNTGEVSGLGGSFIIDPELLPKLKFIREGEFDERVGAPTIRIVGKAKVVGAGMIQPVKTVSKTVAIRSPEIMHAFLDEEKPFDPKEYIRQICYETSAYFPVYYFIKLAKSTRRDTLSMVQSVQSRFQAKHKLMERLEGEDVLSRTTPDITRDTGRFRAEFRDKLLLREISNSLPAASIKYALQAIRTIPQDKLKPKYLRPLLREWFDKFYTDQTIGVADELRRAICYLDRELYRE
jgi:hypothetical protein